MAIALRSGGARSPRNGYGIPLTSEEMGIQRDPLSFMGDEMNPAGMGQAVGQPRAMGEALPVTPDASRGFAGRQLPGMFGQGPRSLVGARQLDTSAGLASLPAVARVKPHFFDQSGLGTKILRGLGEFGLHFAAMNGAPAAMMTLRNRQGAIEDEREDAQWQRRYEFQRRSQTADWLAKESWKQAHPDDQFTQYMVAAGIDPASPQARALYRQRAESMAAPPLMAVDGFDAQGNPTKTFMPRTGFGPSSQPPSQGSGPPVGTVRNGFQFQGGNPNDRANWAPVGGASSGGGATFR